MQALDTLVSAAYLIFSLSSLRMNADERSGAFIVMKKFSWRVGGCNVLGRISGYSSDE